MSFTDITCSVALSNAEWSHLMVTIDEYTSNVTFFINGSNASQHDNISFSSLTTFGDSNFTVGYDLVKNQVFSSNHTLTSYNSSDNVDILDSDSGFTHNVSSLTQYSGTMSNATIGLINRYVMDNNDVVYDNATKVNRKGPRFFADTSQTVNGYASSYQFAAVAKYNLIYEFNTPINLSAYRFVSDGGIFYNNLVVKYTTSTNTQPNIELTQNNFNHIKLDNITNINTNYGIYSTNGTDIVTNNYNISSSTPATTNQDTITWTLNNVIPNVKSVLFQFELPATNRQDVYGPGIIEIYGALASTDSSSSSNVYFHGSMDDVQIHAGILNSEKLAVVSDTTNNYDPQLIAGYRFDSFTDDTCFDESSNSNNGTFKNGVQRLVPSYTPGNVGAQFESASNQYIEASMDSNSDFNQMTLSAWVNTTTGSAHTLAHKEAVFTWGIDANGFTTFSNNSFSALCTSNITNDTWTHLATTVDQWQSKVSFYQNGVLVNSNDLAAFNLPKNNSNLLIGWDSNSTYYNGKLDDVLIYDTVLNATALSDIGSLVTQSSNYSASATVSNNTWTHVAATYDNATSEIQLYHDGSNVASYSNYSMNVGSNNSSLLIGRQDTSTYYYGAMDDVRIYSKALSQGDVSTLYDMYSP